jgi:hypothetical protein
MKFQEPLKLSYVPPLERVAYHAASKVYGPRLHHRRVNYVWLLSAITVSSTYATPHALTLLAVKLVMPLAESASWPGWPPARPQTGPRGRSSALGSTCPRSNQSFFKSFPFQYLGC